MKYVVNNQVILSRVPEGPIAAHINTFAAFLGDQGYALYSVHIGIRIAADFSRWLQQQGIGLHRITSSHPEQYLRYRAGKLRPHQADAAALRHLICFLHDEGVIPAEKESVH